MEYEFFAPRHIVFGWGHRRQVGMLAKTLGRRAFVVSGSRTLNSNGVMDELCATLKSAAVQPVRLTTISREPEVDDVDNTVKQLLSEQPGPGDLILAVGGGSAIDLAKAVSAMTTNREGASVKDYLEGVGRGLSITVPPLPVLAMPTTAGTGTEATKNAVISSYEPAFKKSLRSPLMVPQVVLVDPELSVSVSPETTACTGMDAITQLIESYISRRARPIPQALCLQGLELAIPAIAEAVNDGRSQSARTSMAHAALLSGMALANSGLGMAHGVAAALGVHARVPHGLACAVMLPVAMRVNAEANRPAVARLGRLFVPGSNNWPDVEAAQAAVDFIRDLCLQIDIPQRLSDIGVQADQLPAIVQSSRGNSMSGNPRDLSDAELLQILEDMQ